MSNTKKPVLELDNTTIKCNFLPHQKKCFNSKQQIAGMVGSRGLGKSVYLSVEAIFEILRGGKVLLFGLNYKALKLTLFGEVIKRFREIGIEPQVSYGEMSIKYGDGALYGLTYENIEACRGYSEVNLLLADELALAPQNFLNVASPCLRGCSRPSKIRFATTPRKGSYWNRFFKNDTPKDIFRGVMSDNTTLSKEDLEIAKKAISDENMYKQEILGEILDDDADFVVISSRDFPTVKIYGWNQNTPRHLGIDCSGSGGDLNAFVVTDDYGIIEIETEMIADTFKLTNIACRLINEYRIDRVSIDCTGGFGNGLADMLERQYPNIVINRINFGQKAKNDNYANARAEMYFNMAEKIRTGFYIDNEQIKEELAVTTYLISGNGKTMLTPKVKIKEVLGRSPDITDALALSLYSLDENMSKDQTEDISMSFAHI